MIIQETPSSLALPRLLCLHGGGTNAQIFHMQTRALRAQLQPYFRLCFADAPFICQSPGPDVTAVYADCGPFRRWLRWLAVHPEIDTITIVNEVETAIEAAMAADDAQGATGEWVGVLGFSQGAKLAGSLLLRQQSMAARGEKRKKGRLATAKFRFAVLMAGRGPLVSLEPDRALLPGVQDAALSGMLGVSFEGSEKREHVLRLPTIHVHGMQDPGLGFHQQLLEQYCEDSSARLVEWDGNHRLPIKKKDVAAVVGPILDVAKETGVLIDP